MYEMKKTLPNIKLNNRTTSFTAAKTRVYMSAISNAKCSALTVYESTIAVPDNIFTRRQRINVHDKFDVRNVMTFP